MDNSYFEENTQSSEVKKVNKNSVSIPTLIISLITTIVLVVIVINNFGNIKEMFGFESEIQEIWNFEKLVVWDEVKLSWDIFDDGDLVNYTHVFDSKEYGELWLKSQNINLNNYDEGVYLEWIVEKIQQWIPVIEVDTIYSLAMDEEVEEIEDEELTWDVVETKYLSNVWLYLDWEFFERYSLVNEWDAGVLKIKNIETNQIINLDYFTCSTSINEQNCDRFNEMFAVSSVKKFVQSDSTVYYKQSEVQSWFFSNGSLIWYFINDTDDGDMKDLVKYITIVNEDFVENNILDTIDSVCREPGVAMKNIQENTLYLKNNELYLDIVWDDGLESKLSCELKLNVVAKNMVELVKLEVTGELTEDEKNNEKDSGDEDSTDGDGEWDSDDLDIEITENFDWDSDVEQFPINLDKALEFTSRRGHTIVFPSSNIAYAGKSVQEDFDQLWVSCFSVMNVVKYSEKEDVDQKGSAKVYECSVKEWFDDSSEKLIYKSVWDKHFVVEVVDPSWVQFANNINILIK